MTGITINLFCKAISILIDLGYDLQNYPQGESIVIKTRGDKIISGTGLKVIRSKYQKQYHIALLNHDGNEISIGGGTEVLLWGDELHFSDKVELYQSLCTLN